MAEKEKDQGQEPIDEVQLNASADDRKGHYANFFLISEGERVVILDCFLLDLIRESDDKRFTGGVLSSRILMDQASTILLRDALSEHIEKNGWNTSNV